MNLTNMFRVISISPVSQENHILWLPKGTILKRNGSFEHQQISLISIFKSKSHFVATQKNHLKKDRVLLSINKINMFNFFVQSKSYFVATQRNHQQNK